MKNTISDAFLDPPLNQDEVDFEEFVEHIDSEIERQGYSTYQQLVKNFPNPIYGGELRSDYYEYLTQLKDNYED